MRIVESLREASRDAASGAGWCITFALLFAALVGGLVLAADVGVMRAVTDAREYVDAGAATFVMKADHRIDGRACEGLNSLNNVTAAGAVRQNSAPLHSAALPQTPIPIYSVTQTFGDLLSLRGHALLAGLSVSEDVAAALGVDEGDQLSTTSSTTRIRAVFSYPDDGRDSLLTFAAIETVLADGEPFDGCWATIWPQDENAVAALGRTVLPGDGAAHDRPVLAQLNPSRGSRFSRIAPFDHSLALVPALTIGAILGSASVLRRRLSLASDRHAGVGRSSQVITQTAQVALWSALGTVASLSWILVVIQGDEGDRFPLVGRSAAVLLAAGSCAMLAAGTSTCLVRERSLFRFFKDR